MSDIDWVDGAEFFAGGLQRKVSDGDVYFYGEKSGMWVQSGLEMESLAGYDDHQVNPNASVANEPIEPKENSDWTDKHYGHYYKLTDEDISAGQVKVDAYFVNRMWKINSWDDSGAAFHIVKTLPRIANSKNPLKRELVALKKQVDILCNLHGISDKELL